MGPLNTSPTELHSLNGLSVALFGPGDWSLRSLQVPADADMEKNSGFVERLARALSNLGAMHAYAPNVVPASGAMANPEELATDIPIGRSIDYPLHLWRNQYHPADGTVLTRPGDAGIFSAGGCPMIVMKWRNQVGFAHAGRDSLLDRELMLNGTKSRRYESVVDALIAKLRVARDQLFDAHVWVLWSIRPEDFAHPFDHTVHGKANQVMARYIIDTFGQKCARITATAVHLDLPELIQRQCMLDGIPPRNIHLDYAYLPPGTPTTRTPGQEHLRSLIVVVRR